MQTNFRRRVKVWLAHRNETVTALAARIGRRRDTVSSAIHSGRFPRVRAQIAKAISP
jgi:DNA-binding Xre family transcriptional regulator